MARPPITLAIEISNPSSVQEVAGAARPGVAIGEGVGSPDARVLGVEVLTGERAHDDDLLPAIDRLTRRLGLAARDLARVAVSVGPGGFTSLRLAVAAAKMICEATGAACCAVPTAKVAAVFDLGSRTSDFGSADPRSAIRDPKSFAVALASKHDSAFVTVFGADGRAAGAGRVVVESEVASLGVGLLLADAYLPKEIGAACAAAGVEIRPLALDAASCFFASLDEPDVDPMALGPIYPRPPEAVTKWRALHPEKYGRGKNVEK